MKPWSMEHTGPFGSPVLVVRGWLIALLIVVLAGGMVAAVTQQRQRDITITLPPAYIDALDAWLAEPRIGSPETTPTPELRAARVREVVMSALESRVQEAKVKKALQAEDDVTDLRALTTEQCAAITKIVGKSLKRCGGGSVP